MSHAIDLYLQLTINRFVDDVKTVSMASVTKIKGFFLIKTDRVSCIITVTTSPLFRLENGFILYYSFFVKDSGSRTRSRVERVRK